MTLGLRGTRRAIPAALSAGLLLAAAAWADDPPASSGKDLVVTQKGGTRYLSLQDWPVTRDGNVMRRATLEEYLSLKFGKLDEAMTALVERQGAAERRLHELEEQQKGLQAQVRQLDAKLPKPQPKEAARTDTAPASMDSERAAQPAVGGETEGSGPE